jgi:hypothetical protein
MDHGVKRVYRRRGLRDREGTEFEGFRKGSSSVDIAVIVSICLCLFRWNSW